MKKTAFLVTGLLTAVLSVACRHAEKMDGASVRLTATIEADATSKTTLSPAVNGVSQVLWSADDKIAVYADDAASPTTFRLTEGAGTPTAIFAGGDAGDRYLAFYPAANLISSENGQLQIKLPAEQKYVPGSFADGAYPMVASSESSVLPFKNLCSVLKLSISGDETVRRIVFRPHTSSVKVAGKATVDLSNPAAPTLTMASDAIDSLVLNTGSIRLSDTPTDFYLVLPAQKYSRGFTVRVYSSSSKYMEKRYDSDFTMVRSRFHPAGEICFERNVVNTVTYQEADGEVLNPERGMYTTFEIWKDTYNLTAASVKSKVAAGHKLVLLEFYLKDYMYSDISSSYLETVQKCFDAVREAGAKAIVRFAYKDSTGDFPNEDMEPEVDQVLSHVAQLKPYLQKNEDVLFVLQAGFIGTWGEWYYTSHFVMKPKTDEDYEPRRQLTAALLDAVPKSRQIELRTPRFKMAMYHLSLADTLTASKAHKTTDLARLAGHNDCFGATSSDMGTFDGEESRQFWKAETRYTIMGGETCQLSDYCLCANSLKDLEDYHWTYLHSGYNKQVLNRWKTDGCMDEIKARLGYRLVLEEVEYQKVKAGKECPVTLRLRNKGFAAPMNPRKASLVWVDADGSTSRFALSSDPRTWHPGAVTVTGSFTPVTNKGTLYLELADPLLSKNPDYSIALANKDVYVANKGYNKLFEVK